MSYELIGIIFLGVSQIAGFIYLHRDSVYLNHEYQEQLRRNLAMETQFQKWNADQTTTIQQKLDHLLEMLRTKQL